MPSPKEHDVTVDLMIQAAEKLTNFTVGYTFEAFLSDEKTQSAVIM